MAPFRHIFACLVHERPDCVVDLVRNLHHLDPSSLILLYNGGHNPKLLEGFPFEHFNAVIHPTPRPMKWGWLHDFALDCFRFAREHHPFDAMTIVDSDQLGLRPGYSEHLRAFFSANPGAGLLGNVQAPHGPGARTAPAVHARREVDLWRPFLRRFPNGESQFVHWTFWPSTVFSADAAQDLVSLFERDAQLQDILRRSRIWATEEVLFPTLTALLGHRVLTSPCDYEVVRYRVRYSSAQLDAAMAKPNVFWAHPIPRQLDDPLRTHVRNHFGRYERPSTLGGISDANPNGERSAVPDTHTSREAPVMEATRAESSGLLLTRPILAEMREVEGWLTDDEADLLIAATSRALTSLPATHAVVEVGSYCGKATVVLGRVAQALGVAPPIHAIDPGDGVVGARGSNLQHMGSTRAKLEHTLQRTGLAAHIQVHHQHAPTVAWNEPISLLLVDGLHDYASVSADFLHLEPWLAVGGLVAFHDCADYFPGVKRLVRELLHEGRYRALHTAGTLVVLEKRAMAARQEVAPSPTPPPARTQEEAKPTLTLARASAASSTEEPRLTVFPSRDEARPTVSCIMPTFNRRQFVPLAVRWFLAQDWPEKELIIVDDGTQPVEDLLPEDPRIRYLRLERRHSVGAKRNLACQSARGELIVHWDDDDWSAPRRLRYQATSLLDAGASVCGLTRVYYHQPATDRSWQYVYPAGQRPWVSGNTLCYTKSFWSRNPFPDINIGEDARFLWSDPSRKLLVLDDPSFFVACIHDANVDPKRVHHRYWHPHPTDTVRALMGDAFDAVHALLAA
ncbi:glycosyltransferase [Myxococcus sp. CA040A]|uniref:glycosyltransferase n=1 Tax=Myxococcus sp. CA040A TaxID=2741738 RepID=UPI00157B487A|nr:glycosyltransferase [Myxococcus sp. CA040A]NTX01780.1 glycosyltransferase [Myxococcus sp. CA040A]